MKNVPDTCSLSVRRRLPITAIAVAGATATALMGLAAPASAQILTVTSVADTGSGTLREAITMGNVTPGADVIQLDVSGVITLASPLPTITDTAGLTVTGPGAHVLKISGDNTVRILTVDGGALHLTGVTLSDGSATGAAGHAGGGGGGGAAGLGGALYVAAGSASLSHVDLAGNAAVGGPGGGGGVGTGGTGGAGGGLLGGAGGLIFGGSQDGQPGGFGSGGGGGAARSGVSGGVGGAGGFGGGGGGGAPSFGFTGPLPAGGAGGTFGGAGSDVQALYEDGGGGGGAALGGAIFVQSGALTMDTVALANNSATGGAGGKAKNVAVWAESGQGKGGAIFVADGASATGTSVTFQGNAASDDADEPGDDDDVHGTLVATAPRLVVSPFDAPVTDGDVNLMKAGRTVPFKFFVSLQDAPVDDLDSVSTVAIRSACDTDEQTAPIDEVAAGGSGLQNLGGGLYQFNYKTSKGWAGQCWTLGVDLGHGVTRTATFEFH